MNVLSLFDGMSCGRIALERAGVKVTNYFASEIDKYAVKVSKANWSDIIHIGDVTKVSYKDGVLSTENGDFFVGQIDLVIGGSPCQSISNLGDRSGMQGKSGLFYEFLRILHETDPSNFLLENVKGSKSAIAAINEEMQCQPVEFNSNLVSAQNRKRLYWTDIEFELPKSISNVNLLDILDSTPSSSYKLSDSRLKWLTSDKGQLCLDKGYANLDPIKAGCLTARSDASWNSNYVTRNGNITKLSVEECEKLQTVPVGYTSCVSDSQRYKMLGNGWTVDVVAHIFKGLPNRLFA